MVKIAINTDFITLGQFLKFSGIISNGGEAKTYLNSTKIMVNGEFENRRGKKLRAGDVIQIGPKSFQIELKNED